MIFLLTISTFFYSFGSSYIPSITFFLPFYLRFTNFKTYINSIIPLTALVSFFLAIIINPTISYTVLLKSIFICFIYPISFTFGNYLSKTLNRLRIKDINKFMIYSSFFLTLISLNRFLHYEASAIGRTFFGLAILFYYIILENNIKLKFSIISILFLVLLIIFFTIHSSLTGYMLLLGSIITFLFLSLFNFFFKDKMKIKKSFFKLLILFLGFLFILYIGIDNFEILNSRRINNFLNLFKALRNIDPDILFSLGGGRFLATSSAYLDFFQQPFNFSNLLADLPTISRDNSYLEGLINYSGLQEEYFTSRRAGAYIPWLLFNLRIFALPYLIHIFYIFNKIIKNLNNNEDIRYKFILSGFGFYFVYTCFISSPTSLCLPWIIFSFINSNIILKRTYNQNF